MMQQYTYQVADFAFQVVLPAPIDAVCLMPSFVNFLSQGAPNEELLFTFTAMGVPMMETQILRVVEESNSDMGHTRLMQLSNGGYRLEMTYNQGQVVHIMYANADFTDIQANIQWNDDYAGSVLTSMLRIAYAQSVLKHNALSLHASTVVYKGRAILFMGESGTGKSTHASLWQQCFNDAFLLNDDNPSLRVFADGCVMAYGTPWSGKTPCYKNESYPVEAIVRLHQAKENKYKSFKDVEAFTAILPGCSAIRVDKTLYDHLCDTLVTIAESVKVGELVCMPNQNAAQVCATSIFN
jgi:hypothetical protein